MGELSLSMPRAGRSGGLRAPLRLLGDNRLCLLAADGSQPAFAAIYERHHQGLYRYCRSLLRNDEDAQDALHNTMVKALDALPGEARRIRLKPWLYRIAHNEAIALMRRRRPTTPLEAAGELPAPTAADAATRDRLRTLLDDLGELPERQRSALVMRELSGLSYEEIAAALGTSAGGAKQTVYDARVALHELSKGHEMECESVREQISAGDRRVLRARKLRGHLRGCVSCRAFDRDISERSGQFAALAPPLPAVAAAGLLQQILGAGAGTGGAAGGSVAGSAAVKLAGPSAAKVAIASIAAFVGSAGAIHFADESRSSGHGEAGPAEQAISSTDSNPAASSVNATLFSPASKGANRGGGAQRSARQGGSRDGGGSQKRHQRGSPTEGARQPGGGSSGPGGSREQVPPSPGGLLSDLPVGPSLGQALARADLPVDLPPKAQPHVPTVLPAGGAETAEDIVAEGSGGLLGQSSARSSAPSQSSNR